MPGEGCCPGSQVPVRHAAESWEADSCLVSVVIPTYNRARLLPRAIRSVLQQTCSDLQVILVDDASTDHTPAVAARFVRKNPRIRYYRNDVSLHVSGSRNVGLAHARGKFVAFLDDDDEWLPDKLELQLPLAASYSVVGCTTAYDRISSRPPVSSGVEVSVGEKTLQEFFFDNRGFSPTTMLTRTEYARRIGGFDEHLEAAEGLDFFVQLVARFGKAAYVKRVLAVHHTRHGEPRITEGPKRLAGLMREFGKNRDIMSPAARRYRLCMLRFAKMHQARDLFEKMVLMLRGLSYFDLRRMGAYLRLIRGAVLVRLPFFPRLLVLYRRVKYR